MKLYNFDRKKVLMEDTEEVENYEKQVWNKNSREKLSKSEIPTYKIKKIEPAITSLWLERKMLSFLNTVWNNYIKSDNS